jgi:hypothetical protein
MESIMLRASNRVAIVLICVFWTVLRLGAQQPPAAGRTPGIEERTSAMQKLDGYFPLYWDERTGTLWLEIPRFNTEFLYTSGLAAGLGSNDIGLDRGQGGGGKVVSFERAGPKVFMVQGNESFRSSSANPAERRSVEDSFAKSILWGFTVAAESNGRVLVDATDFVVRDGHGAANALRPGTYRVDKARSAVYMPRTKGFPKNSEIEVTLTFAAEPTTGARGGFSGPTQGPPPIGAAGGRGGGFGGGLFSGSVASVTPTPDSVTIREHYSLVELPDNNFKPRFDDPRAGYFGPNFVDYSVPIGEPMVQRYIMRHRLEKKDPTAEISEPVRPIQYWVDSGAPEDVRKALVEGASWWNQAFEAAGFRKRIQGGRAAGGSRPHGHPLQHDQLGASLHARLVDRRRCVRSANRRDHQRQRHPRLAARPAGLLDLRGSALALHHRQREAGNPVSNGIGADSAIGGA